MPRTPPLLTSLALLLLVAPWLRAAEPPLPEPVPAPASAEAAETPSFDARATRLFFAPTARSVPRGRGSAAVTEVIFPSVEVGLSNRVSVAAIGVLPVEDLSDGGIVLAPKIQVLAGPRVQAAVGLFQGFGAGVSGGLGYAVVTLGGASTSATIGYGYGYGGATDGEGSSSLVFLGAERTVGRSFRLIVEGYVGGAGLGFASDVALVAGARFGRGRFSVDLGAVVPFYEGSGVGTPFPVATIAWAF